jgi:hypothetical protein
VSYSTSDSVDSVNMPESVNISYLIIFSEMKTTIAYTVVKNSLLLEYHLRCECVPTENCLIF